MIKLARSKAGHDKGNVYFIYEETEEYVLLVNGESKKLSNPKKKKRIHIQPIIHLPEEINELAEKEKFDDTMIKRILKIYDRRNEDV